MRSDATPAIGLISSVGMVRTAFTLPSSAPDPVRSYTTQPIVVFWIHPATEVNAFPSQSSR